VRHPVSHPSQPFSPRTRAPPPTGTFLWNADCSSIVSLFPAAMLESVNCIFPSQVEPGETCGILESPYPAGGTRRLIRSRRFVSPADTTHTSAENNHHHKAVGLLSFTAPGMNKLLNVWFVWSDKSGVWHRLRYFPYELFCTHDTRHSQTTFNHHRLCD
jgi:hypothetical protein